METPHSRANVPIRSNMEVQKTHWKLKPVVVPYDADDTARTVMHSVTFLSSRV